MDSNQPLISIVIPAFNAEQTIRESIESVLAGTYPNFEIIVVDDGSADRTAELAMHYQRAEERVQLHRRRNGGISAAFNSGLALARGEYVARLDADDIWHPTKLERQVAVAVREPDAAFIYAFVRYIDDRGLVLRDAPHQHFPSRALCRGIYESLVGANSSALMRRSAVAENGGYDESLTSWEDLLLQLRISARHKIACVPKYLVGYRVRPNSLSADPRNMLNSWLRARRLIREHFPQVPEFVGKWGNAKRLADLAEAFAWRRQYGTSLRLLAQAFLDDPAWTSLLLKYRIERRAKRRWARATQPPRQRFFDCNPDEQLFLADFDDVSAELRRLHTERVNALARLDEELAG